MSDFLFALNAIAPIVLMVLLGYLLKRIGLLQKQTATQMNKIVFRVLLPVMLMLNMYKIDLNMRFEFSYILWGVGILVVLFGVFFYPVCRLTPDRSQRGVLLQAIFRSNYALIGIPLAVSLCGDEGAIYATVLGAFTIPVFNALAVLCLTLFGEAKADYKDVLIGIIKNPLILGVAAGGVLLLIRMLFVSLGIGFRLTDVTPVYEVLTDLSAIATPVALLCLGANFEFSAIPALKRQIILGVSFRNLITPLIGIGGALLLGCFESVHFSVFIALFTSPLAVSVVPMTQEMKGDHVLAAQVLVFTTIFSTASIFLCTYALRLLGIF